MATGFSFEQQTAAQRIAASAGIEVIGIEPYPHPGSLSGVTSFAVRNPATGKKLNWTSFENFAVWAMNVAGGRGDDETPAPDET